LEVEKTFSPIVEELEYYRNQKIVSQDIVYKELKRDGQFYRYFDTFFYKLFVKR
jgi:hypothetical protein